jgi:hypothetical protein
LDCAQERLETGKLVADNLRPMREWIALATRPSVVKRSLKYAVIVGLVLILINHSDAILSRKVTFSRFLRMLLTVLVPYTVSTLSSVGTLLDQRRAADRNHQKAKDAC